MSWHGCGGLRLATTDEEVNWLKYVYGISRLAGYECEIIGPSEIKQYHPYLETFGIKAAFRVECGGSYPEETFPGYQAPILRIADDGSGERECVTACFGMVPSWAELALSRHTYNARSETVAEKPSYRNAWHKRQFCLVLADNFYEPNYATGKAVRWRIQTEDANPFGIAGIWDKWIDPSTGELVVSFSMLTVNADEHPVMRQFHKEGDEKRTPVIIQPRDYDDWLGADLPTATKMMTWVNMPDLKVSPQPRVKENLSTN